MTEMQGVQIFSLKGKSVLVTGAPGYLGRAMSFALAEAGAKVWINSRSPVRCSELAAEICSAGFTAVSAPFDVTSQEGVDEFFNRRLAGPLDVIINNAYSGGAGTIETACSEDYLKSYDLSVLAAHRVFKAALPRLRTAASEGGASVINIATMYALVSPDLRIYSSPAEANAPFYGASKAALLQWTRYAACEFGGQGIRVNAVSPGPFPTDEVQRESPEFANRLVAKTPLGRLGRPNEINGAILFLASAAASFVNGANIVVDGGWTAQ